MPVCCSETASPHGTQVMLPPMSTSVVLTTGMCHSTKLACPRRLGQTQRKRRPQEGTQRPQDLHSKKGGTRRKTAHEEKWCQIRTGS